MESTSEVITEAELPIIQIPKNCIDFMEQSFPNNMFIDVRILALNQTFKEVQIYKGTCMIMIVDSTSPSQIVENADFYSIIQNSEPLPLTENETQVWADPTSSPSYNNIEDIQFQSLEEHHTTANQQHILTVKNLSPSYCKKFEHKKFGKVSLDNLIQNEYVLDTGYTTLGEIEYDYGPLLPNLEDLDVEQATTESSTNVGPDAGDKPISEVVSEEIKAVQQLMSPDLRSNIKRRRTILLLGHDEESGAKVQKITCEYEDEGCGLSEEPVKKKQRKMNQCEKCKMTFDDPLHYSRHIIISNNHQSSPSNLYVCNECGKKLKTRDRYEKHCLGHGDPDVECSICGKVFSSKASLLNHRKMHSKKVQCGHCLKFFVSNHNLNIHINRKHKDLNIIAQTENNVVQNKNVNKDKNKYAKHKDLISIAQTQTNDLQNENLKKGQNKGTVDKITMVPADEDYAISDLNAINNVTSYKADDIPCVNNDSPSINDLMAVNPKTEEVGTPKTPVQEPISAVSHNDGDLNSQKDTESILEKILSTGLLTMKSNEPKRCRGTPRNCTVCEKKFDRSSDLKRHLIEHVVKGTLSKVPIENGILNITCDVCRMKTFDRIDKYKVHLRNHAQLTLYKCTYCDKSFSDSSNFSKHRKIHSKETFQCDLCNRKFSSRKTITDHLVYHTKNPPLSCQYCGDIFYFKSSLNKHAKHKHGANLKAKVRCTFCLVELVSLKQKWDHEWAVHNVRKSAADCDLCEGKFRKYSELKRHYNIIHNRSWIRDR